MIVYHFSYSKNGVLAELKVEVEKSVLGCSVLATILALFTSLVSQQNGCEVKSHAISRESFSTVFTGALTTACFL